MIEVSGELARGFDHADLWPRYYMDLARAKVEVEDWMKKRKQWVDGVCWMEEAYG